MKSLTFLCILMLLVITGCYLSRQQNINEGFLSGTDVQLLTSKPYYTWYDYLTNLRRYPYYHRYPYYGYSYSYPYVNYGYYPYYRPTYY